MVTVRLKGIAKVTAKGRTYWYAWRGGPRLEGEPGAPEFVASYHEAHAALRRPDPAKFRAIVIAYKASADFRRLAPSTRRNWTPWIDRIAEHFGDLSVAQFDRPEKIRPVIRRWRNRWADRPRSADYGMQVLSRLCSYAVDPLGRIAANPCEGIRSLYRVDRAERIWTEAEIAHLKAEGSAELGHAVDLAAATGLRLGDLIRLSWSHVHDDAIVMTTGKSRHRREVVIPLYEGLRALLKTIPRRATTVLTSTAGRPWKKDGIGTAINRAKHDAGLAGDDDLHFHDLRGTAATRFYAAGLPLRVIAEMLGWEEDDVERIIRRYVGRTAATKEVIRQIEAARK